MLNIDLFFHAALDANASLIESLGGRVFNTARPETDEETDAIPYVIITYDGGGASDNSKDEYIATLDTATVSVLIVATDRNALADISQQIHDTIVSALEDNTIWDSYSWPFVIDSCVESAGAVQYDPSKPCFFQTLTYQCNTDSSI